ncbi:acetate kinase [Bacillus mesophilus]|uniref:Atypical membrane-integrating protein (Mistic protein) n=1 Tax=Bacillus mesophilus TaxID=1808955 RepID=A0A6M0Q8I1_9BACI|nr:atypical membrane-integrating protein (Mistic protein) [Bacillus mesophilus]MBM7661376.1 acetate kinase [Bacillus mesophilus]NEY72049.1 atypical membrane-integrating protein (Mistic protein) [Bacillus mesophilus]
MKVNEQEKTSLSDSIDKLNEGLDTIIQLYNEAEEDKSLIDFDDDTIHIIQSAKKAYGEKEIDERINKIIKEILSLLPLDQPKPSKSKTKVEE